MMVCRDEPNYNIILLLLLRSSTAIIIVSKIASIATQKTKTKKTDTISVYILSDNIVDSKIITAVNNIVKLTR